MFKTVFAIFWAVLGLIMGIFFFVLLAHVFHWWTALSLFLIFFWGVWKWDNWQKAQRAARQAAARENLRQAEAEVERTGKQLREAQYQDQLDRAAKEAGLKKPVKYNPRTA